MTYVHWCGYLQVMEERRTVVEDIGDLADSLIQAESAFIEGSVARVETYNRLLNMSATKQEQVK